MSSHPYRQKIPPYPVGDLPANVNTGFNSSPSSQESKPRPLNHINTEVDNPADDNPANSEQPMVGLASPRFSGNYGVPHTAVHPYAAYGRVRSPLQSPPMPTDSADSSITNLNLQEPAPPHPSSQSDSNLYDRKNQHTRSVSSTLSFFYEKLDNSSFVDFNQSVIQQYLGGHASTLMPRLKTLEMYRKNAKKSDDPAVLFQYAQYMLQTALMVDSANAALTTETPAEKPTKSTSASHGAKGSSSNSPNFENISISDPQLKRSLLKEAHHYLKRLADKGYTEAQYLLGDAYSSGAFGRVENKEAFHLFLAAAKRGHVESAFRAAHCYEEGLGTGRDARKTLDILRIAASKNHPAAMYKLGMYSFYSKMGLPDTLNTKKAGIKWLERALNVATELTAAAPYELGKLYQSGFLDILLKDEKYALELYAQAAALSHVESSAILGKCYEVGDIVPQDPNLSIHYYTKAAMGGHPESMLAMCAWYLVGSDPYLPKDELEAFEWAKRAAMCDLPKAQFALGNFFEKGIGCIRNSAEAQDWYKKAAEQGEEKALSRITNKDLSAQLAKKMKKIQKSRSRKDPATAPQDKDCVIM